MPGSGPNFNRSGSMRRLAAIVWRNVSMAYSSGWPGLRRAIGSGLLGGRFDVQRLERSCNAKVHR
ncbi:hypothetical protein RBSH_02336 [Rhodopirellula baltica SH28]|uniref:Uncharacterized protein n=1 Tax=Rhodopirellula baltica SH28 TaxID=993517 RepID=K5CEQ4_RHOBT|nr:hypothetical protein RBSH_02336 [Rhodopirellula baltica SH28]